MHTKPAPSGLPSVRARAIGFLVIVLAGIASALIGYAFVTIQCHGHCGPAKLAGTLIGAVVGALGVGVVVVLALRAMSEWDTIQRDAPTEPYVPEESSTDQT